MRHISSKMALSMLIFCSRKGSLFSIIQLWLSDEFKVIRSIWKNNSCCRTQFIDGVVLIKSPKLTYQITKVSFPRIFYITFCWSVSTRATKLILFCCNIWSETKSSLNLITSTQYCARLCPIYGRNKIEKKNERRKN